MATVVSSSLSLCQHVAKENEEECQEEQYSLCPHCNLWLCIPHNLEHQQIVQTDAHALNDRANQVRQQLIELSIDYLYEDCKKKIDEWRDQMHAEINARHADMLQELTKLNNELIEEVKEFKMKKIESFQHEIVEPLTHMLTKQKQVHPQKLKIIETQLQSLHRKIEDIEKPNLIHMNYDEMQLNGEVNFIREYPCNETLNLEVIKQKPTHHFPLKTNDTALAASAHYILAFENPSTLLLFDTKTQLRSIDTRGNKIWDICWSDSMKLFLIAGNKHQTYDIISNNLVDTPIDGSQYNSYIRSVTCYSHDILLLYNNCVIERYSWPSFTRRKKWLKSEYLVEDGDSAAPCIRLNNTGILAMCIKQKDFHFRIDLFDTQMQRTHRGVPLTNNGTAKLWIFQCIPLTNNEWLVMDDSSTPRMLSLVDKNGTLKQQVESDGFNLALMDKNDLILRNNNGLHLYKLS